MSEKSITCIGCPMGCQLNVQLEDGKVDTVDGAACGRGAVYARQECVCPTRMVTSLVRVQGRQAPLSVKTKRPVPKELIFSCLDAIHKVLAIPPVNIGDVLLKNVAGTGIDVVETSMLRGASQVR